MLQLGEKVTGGDVRGKTLVEETQFPSTYRSRTLLLHSDAKFLSTRTALPRDHVLSEILPL